MAQLQADALGSQLLTTADAESAASPTSNLG